MVLRKFHVVVSVAALFACLPGPATADVRAVQPARIQAAISVHEVSVAAAGSHSTSARPVHAAFAVPSPGTALDAVDFVDAQHGWAAGQEILSTADSGQHWRRQYRSATLIAGLDFLTRADGWAWGHALLLRTTDGGQHWRRLPDPAPAALYGIQFLSPSQGIAVTNPPVAYGRGLAPSSGVSVTSDGGVTWRPVRTPSAVTAACFVSARVGWALAPAAGAVLRTSDGGRNWQRGFTSQPLWSGAVGCSGQRNVWLLAVGGVGMNQASYTLYRSADGGVRWHAVAAVASAGGGPAPGKPVHVPAGPPGFGIRLDAVDATTAYVLGGCPICGRPELSAIGSTVIGGTVDGGTVDGGNTWRTYPPIAGIGYDGLSAVSFATARRGWLILSLPASEGAGGREGIVLATGDGGRTWREQYPTAQPGPALAVAFPTARVGYGIGLVGDASAFLRSTDGGRHWQRVASLPIAPAGVAPADAALSFVGAAPGWAVADNGWLLATVDGGRHWRHVVVPAAQSASNTEGLLSAVAFVDRTHGCVQPADYGTALQSTSDGGTHWHAVPGYTNVAACANNPVASALANYA